MTKKKPLAAKARRQGRYIIRHEEWLESSAYRALSLLARCLLEEFQLAFTPQRNGRLVLPVARASERLNVSQNTARAGFYELYAHGFIDLTAGHIFTERQARSWRLTFEPCNGREPTDDWKRWQPDQPVVPVPKKRSQGAKSEPGWFRNCTSTDAKFEPEPRTAAKPKRTKARRDAGSAAAAAGSNSAPLIDYQGVAGSGATDATARPLDAEQHATTSDMAGRQHEATAAAAPASPHLNQTEPAEPIKIGPTANSSQLVETIDLEELIALRGGRTGNAEQEPPQDRVRREALAKAQREGHGSITRLAAKAGVSRGQMSNYLRGRFGLNRGAQAAVEAYIAEPTPEEPTP